MAARKTITREELEEMFARRDEALISNQGTITSGFDAVEARMDKLDENDAIIQSNVEKVYEKTSSDIESLRDDTTEEIARIRAATDAEIAMLKSTTAQTVKALETQIQEQDRTLLIMREENNRFANQNLKMLVVMGACVGVMLVMGAVLASMLREGPHAGRIRQPHNVREGARRYHREARAPPGQYGGSAGYGPCS